jgi:hypothetical protein
VFRIRSFHTTLGQYYILRIELFYSLLQNLLFKWEVIFVKETDQYSPYCPRVQCFSRQFLFLFSSISVIPHLYFQYFLVYKNTSLRCHSINILVEANCSMWPYKKPCLIVKYRRLFTLFSKTKSNM